MPVSKNRRRKGRQKNKLPKSAPKWKFSEFGIKEEFYEDFKKASLEAAELSVAQLPQNLSVIDDILYRADPIGVLATVSGYGLLTTVTEEEGVAQKTLMKGIEQHHAELLQALVLKIPIEKYVAKPFNPHDIEVIFETLPKITWSFHSQRVLAAQNTGDKIQHTILSLQERMRFHTQAVRNWGYFSEIVRISTELFSSLDQGFQNHFKFTATDLIKIMVAIVGEFDLRRNEHWNVFAKIRRKSTITNLVKAYYELVPDLEGSPEEFIKILPPDIDRDSVMAMIMGHFDLRLSEHATFEANQVAALTGFDAEAIAAALQAISLVPGSLADAKAEHLFLGNPIWDAPGIHFGDVFILPIPQMFFSHIHRIMERLAGEAGQKSVLEGRRSEYLERQLVAAITKALPGAELTPSAKWSVGGEQFETDLIATIDRTVLIAEAKSNRLTASALRGARDRVKRHVEDMIVYPSVQSARLESLIRQARDGDVDANAVVERLGIEPKRVDHVLRISVTLDDFSVLSASESEFREIGWISSDHLLAPTINIADLFCITDIIDEPLLFLHYMLERNHLQKSFNLLGDELDFLGLYLETGFNIAGLRGEYTVFSPSGMSEHIDRYYTSKDEGISLPKPRPKLRPLFSGAIQKLNEMRSPGWTTAGLHLLSSADSNEQKKIEEKLTQLRGMVRRNFRDPGHLCSLYVRPPEDRNARVIFYLFPEPLRGAVKTTMGQMVNHALNEDESVRTVVIFGRSTEHWEEPYEAIVVGTRNDREN